MKNSKVEKVLVILPSNIGDVVLGLPVVDVVLAMFPAAEVSIVVGPRAQPLLAGNPVFRSVRIYDKRATFFQKIAFFLDLRKDFFDIVVDLRNSFLPFLLRARRKTGPVNTWKGCHWKDRYLERLAEFLGPFPERIPLRALSCSTPMPAAPAPGYVLVAPGAADNRKRWPAGRFLEVIRWLVEERGERVVIVGDKRDKEAFVFSEAKIPSGVTDLLGQTSLRELAAVVHGAKQAVTNDSGVMHMASYFGVPTVAVFGPTDPGAYGPWSAGSHYIRRGSDISSVSARDVLEIL
ncbi:MAG: glycosyltransferase family 9 protein [Elusimicrobia bacterium]|nr:glycosyltransferase family 9 protein [Elusimicrobiota bacterium]